MTQSEPEPGTGQKSGRRPRGFRCRGAEPIEFTLVLLPFLAMITVLLDTSWAVYTKATLQRAVRIGVRTGITVTKSQLATGACLTDTVKGVVQSNSMGLLGSGTSAANYALIKVHYFEPPAVNSTSAATDVSANSDGDQPGYIMQVSVQNFSLNPLLPRFFTLKSATDKNPLVIQGVYSADLIEPASVTDRPCIGTAP
jgi:Flp pilus assembly protein TadG